MHTARCSPACVQGFTPTEASLACHGGVLTPPTFRCLPSVCRAPWGIVDAQPVPCQEGLEIASGSQCTAQCEAGYAPTANLTCLAGALSPTAFECRGGGTTSEAAALGCPEPSGGEVVRTTPEAWHRISARR